MECPYCKKEMREGYIPAYRDRLKWIAGKFEGSGTVPIDYEEVWLSEAPLLTGKAAEAHLCPDCKAVIVPVKEFKDGFGQTMDKARALGGRLGAATERLGAALEARDECREEARQEKERKKREENIKKGKDPWEW